jgi:AAA+ superfamily predicted ATPase
VYRWRLLAPETPATTQPSDATVFHADASLLDTLLGRAEPDDWSSGTTGRIVPPPADGGVRPDLAREIAVFVSQILRGADPAAPVHVEAELVGPPGSGRNTLGAAVSVLLHASLIAVDCAELAEVGDPELLLVREVRRAVLSRAAIAIVNHEHLPPSVRAVTSACPLTFSCVEKPLEANAATPATVRRSFVVPPLRRDQRLALWSQLAAAPAPIAVAEWGLRPAEIELAAKTLPAGPAAVTEVCRRMMTSGIDDLLTRLPAGPTWDDLVLPADTVAHLKELEGQVRHKDDVLDDWGLSRLTSLGRGTTALFSGPSGTGKTMTAQVLAHSLGLECLSVDLAGVVSKYIGDTEKQLRKVFEACERSPALLFFDEADALFGKRTTVNDAHDRFANIEIDYVLQAMERFNGVAVLATNRKGDLDGAFIRRLRFIVNFMPPSATERETLWRKCFDGAVDAGGRALADGLDYGRLAKELDLTGAQIKSAALAAAFTAVESKAPITMATIYGAARREIEKTGKVVRVGQLGAP